MDPADPATVALAWAMIALMRGSPACVGMAACQVGRDVRVLVVDVTGHPRAQSCHGLLALANPVPVAAEGAQTAREGCLSVPDLTGDVRRATRIVVRGWDLLSDCDRVVAADAFEARALAHELDHLDGLLFLDRLAGPAALHPRRRYR